jgi:hypothetical protein
MTIQKKHDEFYRLDMNTGWETPPGYPPGIAQKILSGSIDDAKKTGFRTRLLKFAPGEYTTEPFVHEHWEEVFLISGDLIVGNDKEGRGGEQFTGFTYACRPPGAFHGPFKSETGALLLEQHYYDWTERAGAKKAAKKAKKAKPAARKAAKRATKAAAQRPAKKASAKARRKKR